MKKYKTTDKHPFYKEGIIIEEKYSDEIWIHDIGEIAPYDYNIAYALEKGWIEEIQEPEFTKNDMIDILEYVDYCSATKFKLSYFEVMNNWLKQRDEKKDQKFK
jgi:hypothetical protein